jgi:hypothetical protein
MGIFDVFKTKMNEAADKVSDMMDKKKDDADGPSAQAPANPEAATEGEASTMVSEGAPVSSTGEAAPGVGDDGAPAPGASDSGMTQSIKDNVAKGADQGGEMAKGATGNRFDEKIDSGVQQAKDKLG